VVFKNNILDNLKDMLKSKPINSTKLAQIYISYFSLLHRFIYCSSDHHRLPSSWSVSLRRVSIP